MLDIDEKDENYRFKIGMLVKHPNADLEILLQPLGFLPDNNRVAGRSRIAPNGQMLPGKYRESFWNWRHLVTGDRSFMASVNKLLRGLEDHNRLVLSITANGGSVSVTIALSGVANIGSRLTYVEMGRLANLQVNLDIEIFPDLRNFA